MQVIPRELFNEYEEIKAFYADRKAERSDVPLINHIQDGLVVMEARSASTLAMRAYCLHPIFQADKDLREAWNTDLVDEVPPRVMLLVMEYRNQANAFLSDKVGCFSRDPRIISHKGDPSPGPLSSVKEMLVADKVQNFKDFLTYHQGEHPRSAELTYYFKTWLRALDVSMPEFESYWKLIDEARAGR